MLDIILALSGGLLLSVGVFVHVLRSKRARRVG